MRILIDHHIDRRSVLHSWHPTCKLVGLLLVMFSVAALSEPATAAAGLGLAASALALTRIPAGVLWRAMRALLLMFVIVFLVLALTAGGPTIRLAFVPVSLTGLELGAVVFCKGVTIACLAVALLATGPFAGFLKSLRSVGVPHVLVQIVGMAYRLHYVLAEESQSIQRALAARGFTPRINVLSLRTVGRVIGSLLARSMDRSDRLYDAMQARGYRGEIDVVQKVRVQSSDWAKLVVALLAAGGFLVTDRLWKTLS